MEENKLYKQYWYAMRILHNRVEACVELLDSINAYPKDILPIFIELPDGWEPKDWQMVSCYPRPEHISYRSRGKRIHKYVPLISCLLFVQATASQIKILEDVFGTKVRIFKKVGLKKLKKVEEREETIETDSAETPNPTQSIEWNKEIVQPVKIPAHEIEILKVILSHGAEGVEQIPTEKLKWGKGTKVRVIDGEFKGWQGEIRRIKGNSRLVVSIRDVQQRAVAAFCVTTYIPFKFLEEITT